MGIKTIKDSRRIVLLATGENKAAAIHQAIEGPITVDSPASLL
jgi:glucosamine-6-phosphate deaminase